MKLESLQIKGGKTAANDSHVGETGEITADTEAGNLRVHDGATKGGHATAKASEVPATIGSLTDDVGFWTKGSLTALSQLTNDAGYWKKSELTKISQLTNDSGFQTGHCSHCTYCGYCTNCS